LSGEPFALFLQEVNIGMMNIFFDEISKEYPDREMIIAMDQGRLAQPRRCAYL